MNYFKLFLILILNQLLMIRSFNQIVINKYTPAIYTNNIKMTSLEHVYPKSFLNKTHHNDMHNLFKCDKLINSKRSNYKYVDNHLLYLDDNWNKLDNNNYVNVKSKLFIPNEESKGLIARAILYMSHNYNYNSKVVISDEDLYEWSLMKPTVLEYNHNELIYKCQKKRNIFIDYYEDKRLYLKYILKLI